MRGKFITFEGGEGCGKSTQSKLLADRLRVAGVTVREGREPGGTPVAEAIRNLFIATANEPISPLAQTLMMNASRDSHVRDVIAPTLDAGDWFICDRFLDSTRVYQGCAAKLDRDIIAALERWVVRDYMPDLTLFLDVPPEIGMARAAARRGAEAADRFERQGVAYHQMLHDGYAAMCAAEPARCVRVDASGTIDAIADAVWETVRERLTIGGA